MDAFLSTPPPPTSYRCHIPNREGRDQGYLTRISVDEDKELDSYLSFLRLQPGVILTRDVIALGGAFLAPVPGGDDDGAAAFADAFDVIFREVHKDSKSIPLSSVDSDSIELELTVTFRHPRTRFPFPLLISPSETYGT